MEQEAFPKFQYSRFTEDRLEQYVVRSNDFTDFVESLEELKAIIIEGVLVSDNQPSPEPLSFPSPAAEPPESQSVPECPIHHVMMKERTGKDGNTWWDHRWKDKNDVWHTCNGSRERIQV